MWVYVVFGLILLVVVVAAVVTERRRIPGDDVSEDRVINPGKHRYKSWADKENEHGSV